MIISLDVFDVLEDEQTRMFFESVELAHDVVPQIYKEITMDIHGVVNGIAGMIASEWSSRAQNASPWGEKYASTITVDMAKSLGDSATVYTNEASENYKFVEFMENGVKAFDIKAGLLSGRKVKYSTLTGRPYAIVPFRWRTLATKNTGKKTAAFSKVMPSEIYQMVKNRVPITESMAQRFIPREIRHQGSILTGLTKTGGGYFTFRVVTPDSKGWLHPGKPATPVFAGMEDYTKSIINDVMDNIAVAYLEKFKKALEK